MLNRMLELLNWLDNIHPNNRTIADYEWVISEIKKEISSEYGVDFNEQ